MSHTGEAGTEPSAMGWCVAESKIARRYTLMGARNRVTLPPRGQSNQEKRPKIKLLCPVGGKVTRVRVARLRKTTIDSGEGKRRDVEARRADGRISGRAVREERRASPEGTRRERSEGGMPHRGSCGAAGVKSYAEGSDPRPGMAGLGPGERRGPVGSKL